MGIKQGSKHLKEYVQTHACEAVPGVQHLGRSHVTKAMFRSDRIFYYPTKLSGYRLDK